VFKGLISGLSRWLENEDSKKRRAPRLVEPALVVYYWDGSVPEGRRIRDISSSGAYVVTPERWYIGTIVRLILQLKQVRHFRITSFSFITYSPCMRRVSRA